MYGFLLVLHSIVRWLLLVLMVITTVKSWYAFRQSKLTTKTDTVLRRITAVVAGVQLVLGISLYVSSPWVKGFLTNFPQSIHQRELRFFGMEHITMMTLALVIVITVSYRAGRKRESSSTHRSVGIWYGIALLLIFFSIPWPFSPFTVRPYFRWF